MPTLLRTYTLIALFASTGAAVCRADSPTVNSSAAPTAVAAPANQLAPAEPVSPDAIPEATALLKFLRSLSGKYILAGQHNDPAVGGRNSDFSASYSGEMPAVWTGDFGFSEPGDFDDYQARPKIVAEAIRQQKSGAIVSLCWHAVPPTADEPVTFRPLPGADPAMLKSVQGRLLEQQFHDILTPGTALYNHWAAQVDAVAVFLKQLQDAHVPVLWRPYHEMNGDWFWWGGRWEGQYTTAALYRQIFDRLVNHHHLKNLLWLWNVDRVHNPNMEHAKYFPGIQYVDVLGLDVYGNDFAQSYYDSMVKLSQGKPLVLAEVGNPPAPEILDHQPLWTYYAIWAGMVRNTSRTEYEILYSDPRYLTLSDPTYAMVTKPYREACGLPPLQIEAKPANFSGSWVINEDASRFGNMGAAFAPAKLVVQRDGTKLHVTSYRIREFTDDEVNETTYALDGSETKSEVRKSPRTTVAKINDYGTAITMDSTTIVNYGAPGTKFTSHETWTVTPQGNRLLITSISDSFRGPEKTRQTLVFDRKD